jgi:hypothetical protein
MWSPFALDSAKMALDMQESGVCQLQPASKIYVWKSWLGRNLFHLARLF